METLTVSVSGPAFSFLLYENVKGRYGQEGFLLGEIVEKQTRAITDNDQRQVRISREVKVNSCVPCPNLCYFYDHIGRIDKNKIATFLGELRPKVVAWYKYQPASSFSLTFREKIVHKQLAEFFPLSPEYFTCCLLINESHTYSSTHSFSQSFVKLNGAFIEQLPFHIVNLSDSNNQYKVPEVPSKTFSTILDSLGINHKNSQGLSIINKISDTLQNHIDLIVETLSEVELVLFNTECEIQKCQEELKKEGPVNAERNNTEVNFAAFEKKLDDCIDKLIIKKSRGKGKSVTKVNKQQMNSSNEKIKCEPESDVKRRLRKRT